MAASCATTITALLLSVLAPASVAAAADEAPGRWEGTTRDCLLVLHTADAAPARRSSCQLLRVDRRERGLLTVRFVSDAQLTLEHITFAGVLVGRTMALRCRQERCQLMEPIQLRVNAVGQSAVNLATPGSSTGMLQATVAQGHCRLSRRKVQCEAVAQGGSRWLAKASL